MTAKTSGRPNILQIMQTQRDSMSYKYRRLADFFVQKLDEAVFLTAGDVAKRERTSESTVVRFAKSLGYGGYPEFQRDLQSVFRQKLTPLDRMTYAKSSIAPDAGPLNAYFACAESNIAGARQMLNPELLDAAAGAIASAERVFVIGMGSSSGIAILLGNFLGQIRPDVLTIVEGGGPLIEKLISITSRDLVIGISFPRFTRWTVDAIQTARSKGARTVAITDSAFSPASQFAEYVLTVPADSLTFGVSYVAVVVVVDALVSRVVELDPDGAAERLRAAEQMLGSWNLFFGSHRAPLAQGHPAPGTDVTDAEPIDDGMKEKSGYKR